MEVVVVLGLLAAFALWGYVSGEQSKVRRAQSEMDQAKERLEKFRHQYECLSELVQKKLDGSIQLKLAEVEQRRREIEQECGNIREAALKSAEKEGEQIRREAWKAAKKMQEEAEAYAASIKNGSNEKVFLLKERLAKLKVQLQTLAKQPQTVTIRWIASQFSEFLDASAKETVRLLTHRKHPALKSAEVVRDEVAKRKEAERMAREYRLRCEYIEQLFPFLADVIDPEEDSLVEQEFWDGEKPWEEVEDESARWLTQSEFEQLSSVEKGQLALNRYLARKMKSRWEVGMEYEDFVGYEFERDGFQVEYVGMAEGLKDMGRDLICQKGRKLLVVQCKNWSQEKILHEKHICQLFGTALEYALAHGCEMAGWSGAGATELQASKTVVIPVFVTTTALSETAKAFARRLGVLIRENHAFDDAFPRIKCNVSSNGKIYHLPFDQQYKRTKVSRKGECRVRTVAEAEAKGFRRAMRHFAGGNTNP